MKKIHCFLLALILAGSSAQAQDIPPPPPVVGVPDADTTMFTSVEVVASVDREAWRKHLIAFLTPVIEKASYNRKIKVGLYQVNVRFLVEKDGSISYVKALNDPGFGFKEAAEEAIKTGPKWTPGRQNGRIVRTYFTQPVHFQIIK